MNVKPKCAFAKMKMILFISILIVLTKYPLSEDSSQVYNNLCFDQPTQLTQHTTSKEFYCKFKVLLRGNTPFALDQLVGDLLAL